MTVEPRGYFRRCSSTKQPNALSQRASLTSELRTRGRCSAPCAAGVARHSRFNLRGQLARYRLDLAYDALDN